MKKQKSFPTQRLYRWYERHGRSFPWRQTLDPYAVWVSEIMLQQTQAERVREYYTRFLERFPTIDDLAHARWPSVLGVWRGLGYYGRAKRMMETAKILVREYDGDFPETVQELRELPGIGEYTANAIASICFSAPLPALDTNLKRVLSRFWGTPESLVRSRAEHLYRRRTRSAGKLNQALMDVGALFCHSRGPQCKHCPMSSSCSFPSVRLKPRTEKRVFQYTRSSSLDTIDVGIACIHSEGRYLVGKRPASKGGFWEFPGGKRERRESIRTCIKREIKEELGIEVSVRPAFHIEEWTEGKTRWRLHFCRSQILLGKPQSIEHSKLRWVPVSELKTLGLPKNNNGALVLLQDYQLKDVRNK